jgi:hypothetical protein
MRTGVAKTDRLPPEVASRMLRRKYFHTVEEAGWQLGMSRTRAYVAAQAGIIPTERFGRFLLVRKTVWDAEVRRLKRG